MRLIAALLVVFAALPAWACGADSDCRLGERIYRIYMPEHRSSEPIGAIIFAHGGRGTAAQIMADKSLIALAGELHVALVAPQSAGLSWDIPNWPRHKDSTGKEEFRFFKALVAELAAKYAIDPHRLLMSGFSAGGMLVWELACYEGELFAGYAPIAGTVWGTVPQHCPSPPVSIVHFHGREDQAVPLPGPGLAASGVADIDELMALFANAGNFGPAKPVEADGLDCERRGNPEGKILEFCAHQGGHGYRADFIRRAWQELHIGDH
jgi:polyhydroxybutyrate depolymerase